MSGNKISIIIPTLNEAVNIECLLLHLLKNSTSRNIHEILIVDCGSTDNTQDIVKEISYKYTCIKLLVSEKGRAKQMNFGALKSKGNILYFLHADSFPPKNFDSLILKETNNGNQSGCFRMKFDSDHLSLKIAGWFTQFNFKSCRGGDQSLFITKVLFKKLNGFNERFVVYEDQDFINRIYESNKFTVIQKWLTTSSRRYETNGIWKLQYHFAVIHLKKYFGATANELLDYYNKYIKTQ